MGDHSFEPQHPTSGERRKQGMGQATVLAVKRLAGVAQEMNLRSGAQARKHANDIHPSGPTKRTCVLQIFFLKFFF